MTTIGILALQGGFRQHAKHLDLCQVSWRYVKQPHELAGIDGLILPGGESSALLKLMQLHDWLQQLRDYAHQGGAVFGTCAGMILLAEHVSPQQDALGLLPIHVDRNAYGRQLESFVDQGTLDLPEQPNASFDMVFIRAPRITHISPEVTVLARHNTEPTLVQHQRVLAASFHPELSQDTRLHRYFCALASQQ